MLNLNFTNDYDVVHLTPEIGKNMVGGICTFINNFYNHNKFNHGFIQIHGNSFDTIQEEWYKDINDNALILGLDEIQVLSQVNCKKLVVHFFPFSNFLTQEMVENKEVVFVVHSIPTSEPLNLNKPFNDQNTKEMFEIMCNIAKIIICVSEAEKNKLLTIFPYLEPNNIIVIYNGIELTEKEQNNNFINSRKTFGYIGRMEERKGLFNTIRRLHNIENVKLKIASGGHINEIEINKILTFLSATQSYDKIDFLGWCDGERKENFFKSIDALIVPSIYEPFGFTLLEGIQYGLPIICSNCGGLGEILGSEYKYQFNGYDDEEFYKVLSEFMNDSEETIKEQILILKERIKNFNIEVMVENYNFILNMFLGGEQDGIIKNIY